MGENVNTSEFVTSFTPVAHSLTLSQTAVQ